MDTSITTQYNPATGREAPNFMNPTRIDPVQIVPAVSAAPQTPRQSRVPEAMARRLAPQLHTPERTTAQHDQIGTPVSSPSAGVASTSEYEYDTDRGYVVIPSSFTDANEWGTGSTGFSHGPAGDRQVEGQVPSPTVYHVETRLPNGKPALLLDIGSVGNLAGDEWVRQQAAMALRAGLRPEQKRRERPLTVRGVGQGGEKCTHNCVLPVALLNTEGRPVSGTFDTPTVPGSQLPALLGLSAARESRMLIDTMRNTIYMVGPGEYDLMSSLPLGTQQFA